MKSMKKASEPMPSIFARFDDSPMSERDREIAKAYMRKTEAVLDVIWFVGARLRAAIAGALGMGSKPVLE